MKKAIGAIVGALVVIGGLIGYLNLKIGEISKQVEVEIVKSKQEIEKQINAEFEDIRFFIVGDMSCQKEGWLLPSIVCKSSDLALELQENKKNTELFSLNDFSIVFESTIPLLMGKEVELRTSGKIKISDDVLKELKKEDPIFADRKNIQSLLEWVPSNFKLLTKVVVKDDKNFEVTDRLDLSSGVLKNTFKAKAQYEEKQGKNFSLFDFLSYYFSAKVDESMRETLIQLSITTSAGEKMKEGVDNLIAVLSQMDRSLEKMTPEIMANFAVAGIDALMFNCRECEKIPHSSVFADYVKDLVNILAGKKESSTLNFEIKEGADTDSLNFAKFRSILRGESGENPLEVILGVLKEYNVSIS